MKIDHYAFGSITVDGKVYNADLIIFPDHIQSDWWRTEGHSLAKEDLKTVFAYRPEVLIIGRGSSGCMKIPPETARCLQEAKIRLIDKPTSEAYQIFNREISAGKKAVGAFHLTC